MPSTSRRTSHGRSRILLMPVIVLGLLGAMTCSRVGPRRPSHVPQRPRTRRPGPRGHVRQPHDGHEEDAAQRRQDRSRDHDLQRPVGDHDRDLRHLLVRLQRVRLDLRLQDRQRQVVSLQVAPGLHRPRRQGAPFAVRAKDAAGNVDPTPATWNWRSKPRPPSGTAVTDTALRPTTNSAGSHHRPWRPRSRAARAAPPPRPRRLLLLRDRGRLELRMQARQRRTWAGCSSPKASRGLAVGIPHLLGSGHGRRRQPTPRRRLTLDGKRRAPLVRGTRDLISSGPAANSTATGQLRLRPDRAWLDLRLQARRR